MPNLPVYNDDSEKNGCFDRQVILTRSDFDKYCKALLDPQKAFFRGLSSARYRLYSSAQREWITKELIHRFQNFDIFINELIDNARKINGGLMLEFMNNIGANDSDISILSFLQHYGAPTPFIDFTHDFGTALFFALDGNQYQASSHPLDQFFSVYMLKEQADFINFKDVISNNVGNLQHILNQHPTGSISNADELIKQLLTPSFADIIQYNHIFYLSDFVGGAPHLRLNTNLNIIAQKGMFVLNPSPDKSLDQYMTGITSSFSVNGNSANPSYMPKIVCFDIHKSLMNYVSSVLATRGVTRTTIYPQEEGVAKMVYSTVLSTYP